MPTKSPLSQKKKKKPAPVVKKQEQQHQSDEEEEEEVLDDESFHGEDEEQHTSDDDGSDDNNEEEEELYEEGEEGEFEEGEEFEEREDTESDEEAEGEEEEEEDDDLGEDPLHITVQIEGRDDASRLVHLPNDIKLSDFRESIADACALPRDSKFIIARKRKTKPPQQITTRKHFDYVVNSYLEHGDQFLRLVVTPPAASSNSAATATATLNNTSMSPERQNMMMQQQQQVVGISPSTATTTTLPILSGTTNNIPGTSPGATMNFTTNNNANVTEVAHQQQQQQPPLSASVTLGATAVAQQIEQQQQQHSQERRPSTSSSMSPGSIRPTSAFGGSYRDSDELNALKLAFESGEEVSWTEMKLLGTGAYGKVVEAITNTGNIVAVKHVVFPANSNEMNKHASEVETMVEEIRLMKNLRHRHIVGYYGCQSKCMEDGGRVVDIFMEACHGGSLTSLRKKIDKVKGRLPVVLVRTYVRQILEGLLYLHLKGVVHRDLKGDNILLSSNGVAKLADFGCSKKLGAHSFEDTISLEIRENSNCSSSSLGSPDPSTSGTPATLAASASTAQQNSKNNDGQAKTLAGTPLFLAPEVLTESAEGYDQSADIWSLGCLIIELFGKKPWALQNASIFSVMFAIAQSKSLPTGMPSDVDPKLLDFLTKCFERDPSQRPSARQMLEHPWIVCADNELVEPVWQSDTKS